MKQNGEMNRLGKGCGSESVREAGKGKIFQRIGMFLSLYPRLCRCILGYLADIFVLSVFLDSVMGQEPSGMSSYPFIVTPHNRT